MPPPFGVIPLASHEDTVNTIFFLPDQSTVVTSCDHFKARVFDADSGALLRTFENPAGGGVVCLAVLGWDLAVSGGWREVFVWRPSTGAVVFRGTVNDGSISALASPTPAEFLVGMGDGSLHFFSLCDSQFALAHSVVGAHQDGFGCIVTHGRRVVTGGPRRGAQNLECRLTGRNCHFKSAFRVCNNASCVDQLEFYCGSYWRRDAICLGCGQIEAAL